MDKTESVRTKIAATLDLPIEKVIDEVELLDLAQSSFLLVELVVELQEEFNVQVMQEDLKDVETAGHLIELVSGRIGLDG